MYRLGQNKVPVELIRARYNLSARRFKQWRADPLIAFPKPEKIRGRNFWNAVELLACERRCFPKRAQAAGLLVAE